MKKRYFILKLFQKKQLSSITSYLVSFNKDTFSSFLDHKRVRCCQAC